MVAQNSCLLVAQRFSDALTFGRCVDNTGEVGEQGMVVVEGAYILSNGVQQASE
jgi:hypothetical protein